MSEKPTTTIAPDRDDPPRFTREMAERGRHVIGDNVIREARPRGRPTKAVGERKEAVSLRISPEVLAHFRAGGPGWQTRIDETLLELVRAPGETEASQSVTGEIMGTGAVFERMHSQTTMAAKAIERFDDPVAAEHLVSGAAALEASPTRVRSRVIQRDARTGEVKAVARRGKRAKQEN